MKKLNDIRQSEHFELRVSPPFMWLRVRDGFPPCRFGWPETLKESYREFDSNSWQIVFRDELQGGKRLVSGDENNVRDYTEEANALLPQEPQQLYVLETQRLIRRFGKETKSYGPFLKASPGKITAIMGGSGTGKSVFLKMLCGYDIPSAELYSGGREMPVSKDVVKICGETGEDGFRHLGYVPQGDVMYPELTTSQSLRYRMRLQFGALLSDADMEQCIRHICMELLNLKEETVSKQQIGQIDWLGKYPSGGQRRRINIAHELVLEPEVLILDEPTSGLSSKDSEDLMDSLELLAKRKKLCIVMTIHQPSSEMFRKIDDLLLLVRGGKLAYYGRRDLALDWLRKSPPRKGEEVKESANEAETILNMIDVDSAPERYPAMFEEFLHQNGGGPTKYNG